jgi:hypothetical protein
MLIAAGSAREGHDGGRKEDGIQERTGGDHEQQGEPGHGENPSPFIRRLPSGTPKISLNPDAFPDTFTHHEYEKDRMLRAK